MAPEVLRMILTFASPAALSACACVSFSLLEITSPLLYHTVTLDSEHRLFKLFCALDPSSRSDAISPYLCLTQIKHLRITHLPRPNFKLLELPRDRLPQGVPLAIHTLSLTVWPDNTPLQRLTPTWRALQLLDPRHIICDGSQAVRAGVDGHSFSHMTRLRRLDLKSCRYVGWPAELPVLSSTSQNDPLLLHYTPSTPPRSLPSSTAQDAPSVDEDPGPWLDVAHAVRTKKDTLADGRLCFRVRFEAEEDARRALAFFDEGKEYFWERVDDLQTTGSIPEELYRAQLALDAPVLQRGLRVEYTGGVVYPFDSSLRTPGDDGSEANGVD